MVSRVPQHLLEAAYGINIRRVLDMKDNPNRPPTASEFLGAYCQVRGYITSGTGRWDEFKACKEVLRDFTDGRLLFVVPPPVYFSSGSGGSGSGSSVRELDDEQMMAAWLRETEKTMAKGRVADRIVMQKLREADSQLAAIAEQDDEDGEAAAAGTEDGTSTSGAGGPATREHKRLKHWGKKNKKLRDKTPYADDQDGGAVPHPLVAYTTNRSCLPRDFAAQPKVRRQDPRMNYGQPFLRETRTYEAAAVVAVHERRQDATEQSTPR